jgi:hypothetical protein
MRKQDLSKRPLMLRKSLMAKKLMLTKNKRAGKTAKKTVKMKTLQK